MEWTDNHHFYFMDAVNSLRGITNATASEIQRLMRDRGLVELSNDQVASHLQKIRQYKTKGPCRMNTKAKIHLWYLLQQPREVVYDDWSIFLRGCYAKLYPSQPQPQPQVDHHHPILSRENHNSSSCHPYSTQVGSESENNTNTDLLIIEQLLTSLGYDAINELLASLKGDIIEQDISGGNHMVRNTIEQDNSCGYYKQINNNGLAMDNNHNGSVYPGPADYSLCGISQPSVQAFEQESYPNMLEEPNESMFNSMQGNNDQTRVPFVENGNLQVGGSSYQMSQLGDNIIPNNEDNNSLTFNDNSFGQDHSGGNHIMVDHILSSGENHNNSSNHSYLTQVEQQQFPVPLSPESDFFNHCLTSFDSFVKLPTFNDNSGGNNMIDVVFNNFDNQVNNDRWSPTYIQESGNEL